MSNGYPPQGQPGGYPPQGQPGGYPPPGGGGYPPPQGGGNKGVIITVIAVLLIAIGTVVTLWLTGVFDKKTTPTTPPPVSGPTTPGPTTPTTGPTAPTTPTTGSTTMSQAFIEGRWCDTAGSYMTFTGATGKIDLPNGNTGQRVVGDYTLSGNNLTITGPNGAVMNGSLTVIDASTMTMAIAGQQDRVTRC